MSEESTVDTLAFVEAILSTWWHDGNKMIQLAVKACIVLVTGSDCMNDDELMTDDSDESVSPYKNILTVNRLFFRH